MTKKKGRYKMKWSNGYRMRFVLVGIVAAMVFGGGSAKADFTWMLKADMLFRR